VIDDILELVHTLADEGCYGRERLRLNKSRSMRPASSSGLRLECTCRSPGELLDVEDRSAERDAPEVELAHHLLDRELLAAIRHGPAIMPR